MSTRPYDDAPESGCGAGAGVDPFAATLARHGLRLNRGETTCLQVNVGLRCNQTCRHCHLEAGPHRSETMSHAVARKVADFAERGRFAVIDVTGGAPELNPHLATMIEWFAACAGTVILRSNLTLIGDDRYESLIEVCRRHRIVITASLPSVNATQAEAQRGAGTLAGSLATLAKLNSVGYGHHDSGLQLNLVCNPTGAFIAPPQEQTERKFRTDLERKWSIVFNNLYTFTNVPLGRFREWLVTSGNYDRYMEKLAAGFNPVTVERVMCRSLVSVSWEGYLYDCDFNQAAAIPMGGMRIHVDEMAGPPAPGSQIAVSDHCYACTTGSGFT